MMLVSFLTICTASAQKWGANMDSLWRTDRETDSMKRVAKRYSDTLLNVEMALESAQKLVNKTLEKYKDRDPRYVAALILLRDANALDIFRYKELTDSTILLIPSNVDSLMYANVMFGQATCNHLLGKWDESNRLLDTIEPIFKANKEWEMYAYCAFRKAYSYNWQGDAVRALQILDGVLQSAHKNQRIIAVAASLRNTIYLTNGQVNKAHQEAALWREQILPQNPFYFLFPFTDAIAYIKEKKYAVAEDSLKNLLLLATRLGSLDKGLYTRVREALDITYIKQQKRDSIIGRLGYYLPSLNTAPQNWTNHLTNSQVSILGDIFQTLGNLDSAIICHQKVKMNTKSKFYLARAEQKMALLYTLTHNYKQADSAYLNCLSINSILVVKNSFSMNDTELAEFWKNYFLPPICYL